VIAKGDENRKKSDLVVSPSRERPILPHIPKRPGNITDNEYGDADGEPSPVIIRPCRRLRVRRTRPRLVQGIGLCRLG
jgi:hypothetical protein